MKKLLFLCSSFLLLLFACDKGTDPGPDDDDDPGTQTVREQLISEWSITGLETNGESSPLGSQDKVTFNNDGTYSIILPELNFFPTTGSWAISSDDEKILINDGDYTLDITELDGNDMILTLKYENFKADMVTHVLTLEKQT